ncbi:unnamed protein product [Rotaria sordida]|uniref:Uncharacterized protein n=1 Tax=Rotaria sordida TaxID=392033 RepID=A0A813ZU10_9BILA|nr:unnamed protein product [Rotaria sordida]
MNQFKQYGLRRLEQVQAIPFLLINDAYLYYVEHIDLITSFELFIKLFLQQYSSTSSKNKIIPVIKAFGSTKVQELAFEQLKWYKQTVNQPVTQYYDKIIELCKKVDAAMLDSLKLKYIMAGIRESLKLHVALQDPKTSDAFSSFARKIEDTLSFTTADNEMQQNEININATTTQKSLEQTTISQKSQKKNIQQNIPP